MSGNPRTNNEIVEEADAVDQLSPPAREHLELLMAGGKEERTTTVRDQLNKEKVYPPLIYDEDAGKIFLQSKYLGSSFDGMIIVCTGDMQGIDFMNPPCLTVVKSVSVQEPPSEAQNDLQERVRISGLVPVHPNILGVEHSLDFEGRFVVIFKNVSCNGRDHMVSLRSVMENHFPMGMPLTLIIVCLREALMGLSEIHRVGEVHKEISAGQIFLGRDNAVKLAFSATIYEYDTASAAGASSSSFPMSKVCKWASAPEVYENEAAAYDRKSDIWLIGIAAFELAYGHGSFARDRAHLEGIIEKIHRKGKLPNKRPLKKKEKAVKALKCLVPACVRPDKAQTTEEGEVWEDFQAMVMICLQRDANSRPSVEELLDYKVFADEEKDAAYVFQCLSDIGASNAT